MKHLRFDMHQATEHPQKMMASFGITYQHATPQSMGDQWWFWNCENVPDPLPLFLSVLAMEPRNAVGWGLDAEQAELIERGAQP